MMVTSSSQSSIPVYAFTRELTGLATEGVLSYDLGRSQTTSLELPDVSSTLCMECPLANRSRLIYLAGEHIDYALFSVFPAAIERDVLIACASRSVDINPELEQDPGIIVLENLCSKYTKQEFKPAVISEPTTVMSQKTDDGTQEEHVKRWYLDIDMKQLRWDSYVKAGYYGVLNQYFTPSVDLRSSKRTTHPASAELLVTGSVPAGSGLSSSAALVVASTLAFLAVNGKLTDESVSEQDSLTKEKLVLMAMENEKRVGVNSGGMDQAASVMSWAGSALYVSFYPALDAQPVPLPPGAVFVCADSLVVSDKVVQASTRYNLRVLETLVAARVLAYKFGMQLDGKDGKRKQFTLREVIENLACEGNKVSEHTMQEALERVVEQLDILKPKNGDIELGMTMEEMIALSGLGEQEFAEVYLSSTEVKASYFQLYKRAKHVFTEAIRVLRFRQICLDAVTNPSYDSMASHSNTALEALGHLMNESHESCVYQYECSCSELDELTRLAREAGAYGSRLTGAGWGGYTVSLVAENHVEFHLENLEYVSAIQGLEA